ncbi:LPXTG cell wall anchor domain-containing protein [Streptomyces sp. NBC_00557]|uniref:LPXTG cell wall anchor domain-containing protein n=1 Tax=Streptomyces sp. NBC_00557 TaxID=2975776 RepID=UPI002E7FB80D|nr:LPXTG cell wall anchor domain-containing protein [Streptomyces sp. NBC_00557]WUC36897.1 LPXTG cell wall anchor domain-containing protein [Streptomyces sp. NBC_00557]
MKRMTTPSRWRVALASAASAALLVAAPLAAAQTAYAQPYPPGSSETLSVSATTVTAGEPLSFSSRAFDPGTGVTAVLESTPVVLGHFEADDDGLVSGSVTIPTSTVTGFHVFRLTSDDPDPSVGVTIYVQGGVGSPPPTSPPPTSPPPHKPPHHHPGKPGHHDGHKGHHGGHHGNNADYVHSTRDDRTNAVAPVSRPQHARLAETGSEKAMTVGGAAAALLVAGSGAVLAVRRRRNS